MKTILLTILSAALLFSCAAPMRMENRNRLEDGFSDAREPTTRSQFTDKNSTISEENS